MQPPTVAESSLEAEYIALCLTTYETIFCKLTYERMNTTEMRLVYDKQRPISVYVEDQSAI